MLSFLYFYLNSFMIKYTVIMQTIAVLQNFYFPFIFYFLLCHVLIFVFLVCKLLNL